MSFRFIATLRVIWILPIYIQQYDVMMTSNYVMVSIKLCLDVANDDYIFTAHGASPVIISVFGRLYMKKNDHPGEGKTRGLEPRNDVLGTCSA